MTNNKQQQQPKGGGGRAKLWKLFQTEQMSSSEDDLSAIPLEANNSSENASPVYFSDQNSPSPYDMSPWDQTPSPYLKSPWTFAAPAYPFPDDPTTGLLASLVREEGHVYSLAASGDLLYAGSDSKNIRVWKGSKEFSGFKSASGLVKAIVVAGDRVFTGHQDGKIRIWKVSSKDQTVHRRVGTLPSLGDLIRKSINPNNYVKIRRHRSTLWLKHFDAVSSLALDSEAGILYSGSWDRTFKAWRLSNSKCLDSVAAHDDAINAVAVGPGGAVFTGSADGTVKMWQREVVGKPATTRHVLVNVLMKQECAVTAVVVGPGGVVYVGTSDGLVNFWDLKRHDRVEHAGTLKGHKMAVLCLAAAGRLVISGSADKTVCVWRRAEGGKHVRVAVLTAHAGPVKCLAVEEDKEGGREAKWVVYSGSLDKKVNVWRVSEKGPEGGGVHRSPVHAPKSPSLWEAYRAPIEEKRAHQRREVR